VIKDKSLREQGTSALTSALPLERGNRRQMVRDGGGVDDRDGLLWGAHDGNLQKLGFLFFVAVVSTGVDTSAMNSNTPPSGLLQQIAQIQSMERGKLSVIKESAAGPFFKLQARENGKNVTRYVPREQVPAVQAAIEGYKQFQTLTEQYADEVILQTRTAIAAGSKKKPFPRRSSSPRSRKSSNS